MQRLRWLAAILVCVFTSGCFVDEDLFPLTGGDTIPLKSGGRLTCSEIGNTNKPEEPKQRVLYKVTMGGKTLYTVVVDGEAGLISFHHAHSDMYIAVFPSGDTKEQILFVTRVTSSTVTFFHFAANPEFVNEVAKRYNVEVPATGYAQTLKGTAQDKKAFLSALAAHTDKAEAFCHCTRVE